MVDDAAPEGTWTSLITGEHITGGRWVRETHGFDSLPLYVRPGTVLPWGARDDRPGYDYHHGLTLRVFPGGEGIAEITVTTPDGTARAFTVDRSAVTE